MKKMALIQLVFLVGVLCAWSALADDFPSKPIKLLVPFNPGGDGAVGWAVLER